MVSSLSPGKALTIEDLLQLPRPGGAIVNHSNSLALWPSSSFAFDAADGKGRTTKSLYLINLDHPELTGPQPPRELLTNLSSSDAVFIDDRTVLFLRPALPHGLEATVNADGHREDHPTELSDKDQAKRRKEHAALAGGEGVELWAKDVLEHGGEEYLVGKFPVSISNLTITQISSEKEQGAILSFSAKVFPDGDIYKVAENKARVEKEAKGSDVRVYDTTFIRHWDEWSSTSGEKVQLHFVRLTRNPDSFSEDSGDEFEHVVMPTKPGGEATIAEKPSKGGKWSLVTKEEGGEPSALSKKTVVKSPLAGLNLECPVGPFGGASDFSVSSTHLVFHSKDPHLNPAWHTRTQVYLLPLSPRSAAEATPKALTVGTQGACSSPTISPDGKRVVWLEMREDGYEADRNRVMVYEIETGERWGATEKWDRSPSSVKWCPCGEKVLLTAEDGGFVKLFQLSLPIPSSSISASSLSLTSPTPEALTHRHSITSFTPLTPSTLLLTSNSLTNPNVLSTLTILPPPEDKGKGQGPSRVEHRPLSSLTEHLKEEKELDEGESFYFAGAEGWQVHGFILFPPGFKDAQVRKESGKKWPLAFLVHGGPQGAWTDSWSTRWNPNIYAAHGYITVTINPTGSTGYGQEFTDRIKNQWGGLPFQDLVAGFEFIQQAYPEIDSTRSAFLGASYGGFMANWVQGHNERLGFKAIVCHDGVFSTTNTWYSTEEIYFPEREFGGTPWTAPENYSRWNPQNHIHKWKTPQLVIHGGRDYRLIEGEGIGVFNTLQRLGIPSRFVYFESENHWVLEPHNGVRWHEEVFKWIDEWTSEDSVAAVKSAEFEKEVPSSAEVRKSGYEVSYST
ncbi:Alpha/Beta hydrolase protein [Leucosporidium creatinivorum]|uniref:Dipeptidyl-peptidase V n=1 Tax=Leucosporidium creatinivorum TaxID=106004 RepID=A0A1Y2E065_9BASI|nr:Alpha/Beta hydrolase protein [Leucosporidium creatinivorum]